MIDLAAYQPLNSDQVFQRVEIVNCKGISMLCHTGAALLAIGHDTIL
jgi:hypothetical protein